MKPPKRFSPQIKLPKLAIAEWKAKRMYNQGYRFVGKHSAVKICEWTRKAMRGVDSCYKNKFYCINSESCIQMSPAVFFCDFNCIHCWRSLQFVLPDSNFVWDSPELIFNESIKEWRKVLAGFCRTDELSIGKTMDSIKPKHFAISLSGEPCIYPHLPELIDIIKNNGMTVFLVTNGAHPEMLQKLIAHQPTNLYITLHAPNEEIYKKECCPSIKSGWARILESLSLLKEFNCETVIRLTLSKHSNMIYPEQYAKIIAGSDCKYIEVKAYMPVGGAREKMGIKAMPTYEEIVAFAKEIGKHSGYKIINKKEDSRVVLMFKS